jgi:hypothetical protein
MSFWPSFIGGGILGGIVSATLTFLYNRHLASGNREFLKLASKADRRRSFIRDIGEWRTRVYRCVQPHVLSNEFPDAVAKFGGACIALEPDFHAEFRNTFHAIYEEIITMTDAQS